MKTNYKATMSAGYKKSAALVLTLVLLVALILPGCGRTIQPDPDPDTNAPSSAGLSSVKAGEYDRLLELIGNQIKAQSGRESPYKFGIAAPEMGAADGAEDSATGGGGREEGYTGTNVQVDGVDEADVIRTDGRYLYVLANNRVTILDTQQPENLKILTSLQWTDYQEINNTVQGESALEFFLDIQNQTLTVITQSYMYQYATRPVEDEGQGSSGGSDGEIPPDYGEADAVEPEPEMTPEEKTRMDEQIALQKEQEKIDAIAEDIRIEPDIWINPIVNEKTFTRMYVYDITNPAAPNLLRSWSQDGSYVSARKIEQSVYVVSQRYQYAVYELADDRTIDPAQVLPAFSQTGQADDWEMIPAEDIRIMPEGDMASQILVSGLNLAEPQAEATVLSVIGSTGAIYASAENLYVAGVRYVWQETTQSDGDGAAQDMPAARDGNAAAPAVEPADLPVEMPEDLPLTEEAEQPVEDLPDQAPDHPVSNDIDADIVVDEPAIMPVIDWIPSESFTDIYRFALDNGRVSESGYGTVPGYLINQFSMDAYDGYLRVATTTGDAWMPGGQTSKNNVYVLNSTMSVAGEVTGLAPGETIKSVRFMGDRVWLVTFRTTDPLFGIDLSDPTRPTVLGELKLPGYSAYLHPISQDRMLGFGYEVTVDGDMAFEDGLKVSLFDISNLSAPREIESLVLGERGSWSDIAYQHKSLMSDPANQLYGFPASLSKVDPQDRYSYGRIYFQGLLLIEATQDQLTLKGGISQIEGMSDWTLNTAPSAADEALAYGYEAIYRGIRMGDQIVTLSQSKVQTNRLADLVRTGSIDLPGVNKQSFEKEYREADID